MNFSEILLGWYHRNKRSPVWRGTKNPYKIWLAEVIMQQTRIEQGSPYYKKFIGKYPTVKDLAKADEQEVLTLWQGLGYYARGRNLLASAKYIVSELGGKFPENYKELLKLKGVGEYTAAIVASVAFGEKRAAADGNVSRVLARIFAIDLPINSASGKKAIRQKAEELIPEKQAGDFNEALMDLGSIICTPRKPKCPECPFTPICTAYATGRQSDFPVKQKAASKKNHYIFYFIPLYAEHLFIKKRTESYWKNLYEFPAVLSNYPISKEQACYFIEEKYPELKRANFIDFNRELKHVLSHRNLFIRFFAYQSDINIFNDTKITRQYTKTKLSELSEYPFPVVIRNFLQSETFKNHLL